jgi:hypothetical protein
MDMSPLLFGSMVPPFYALAQTTSEPYCSQLFNESTGLRASLTQSRVFAAGNQRFESSETLPANWYDSKNGDSLKKGSLWMQSDVSSLPDR